MKEDLEQWTERQLAEWETARRNYAALSDVRTRGLEVDGCLYRLQHNPARAVSSAARVDAESLRRRKCFLCADNLPPEQKRIPLREHYVLLLNPFPIFPRHFTIADVRHLPQRIGGRMDDLLWLSRELPAYTLFYNGPCCGASAPDHAHFQAGSKGFMPIERTWPDKVGGKAGTHGKAVLYWLEEARHAWVIVSETADDASALFDCLYRSLPLAEGEEEPRMNVLADFDPASGCWTLIVFPRAKHRPACYFAEGEERCLCSPASVDLGGMFILPEERDFRKMTASGLREVLAEVCLSSEESHAVSERITTLLKAKRI